MKIDFIHQFNIRNICNFFVRDMIVMRATFVITVNLHLCNTWKAICKCYKITLKFCNTTSLTVCLKLSLG